MGHDTEKTDVEFTVSIAGVALKINTGQLKLPTDAFTHGSCRHFCSTTTDSADIADGFIDVFLTGDTAPDVTGFKRIFDSQDSWAIYSHNEYLYITDQYPPFSKPVWTARFCIKNPQVHIFCSSDIIDSCSQTLTVNPVSYPLDQILLMNYLSTREGVIFHAAGLAFEKAGWTFPGKSGAGKSTLAKLISDSRPDIVLSDDRIVVRKIKDRFYMFGTPWPGEGGHAVNHGVELERLMFLSKGFQNSILKISASTAISRLLPVISVPWYDKKAVMDMMDFCDHLIAQIPVYEFLFLPDASAADFLTKVAP